MKVNVALYNTSYPIIKLNFSEVVTHFNHHVISTGDKSLYYFIIVLLSLTPNASVIPNLPTCSQHNIFKYQIKLNKTS